MTVPTYLTEEERAAQEFEQDALPGGTPGALPGGIPESVGAPSALGAPPALGAPQPAYPTVPPPPPPPPNVQDFTGQATQFSSDWMNNPNPYMTSMATASRAAGDARIAEAEDVASRGLDEWSAGRGLLGSNVEGELQVRNIDAGRRARLDDEARLQEMLANYDMTGRQAAGAQGLDTLSALERQREFDTTAGFTQQDLDQRADQIMNEGRALDLQEARDIASRELAQSQLGQQESQFVRSLSEQTAGRLQQFGLQGSQLELEVARLNQEAELQGRSLDINEAQGTAEINLRAQQLVEDSRLQGRALDIEEARNQATQDIEIAKMAQEGRQFESTLLQNQNQFADSMGLNREQFAAQNAQFAQQFGEQQASRLQQNEQFATALESDEARYALDLGLRTTALELQQTGMEADIAYQNAALIQERELTDAAQQLQRDGLDADVAHKYAVLSQNEDFQAAQVALETRGYNLQESYQEAEQDYKLGTLGIQQQQVELAAQELRQGDRSLDQQAARDQAQIDLAREDIAARQDMQQYELTQREREFAANNNLNERQFTEQQAQFTAQMLEQTTSRLQQNTQFATALQSEEEQNALSRGLQTRALDLQATGMAQDQAFRQAQQEFEQGIPPTYDAEGNVIDEGRVGYQDRVLQLQQEGLDNEDALRWAALESDDTFRAESIRLQELGLTNEQSYREAEIRVREQALMQEWNMFGERLTFDQNAMLNDMTYKNRVLDLQEKDVDSVIANRTAELEYKESVLQEQKDQFDDEFGRLQALDISDQAKFDQMYELWQEYYGKSTTGGDNTTTIVNVTGGPGGTGTGGDTGGIGDYPNIPPENGGVWTWDEDRQAYVDGDGNEYEE